MIVDTNVAVAANDDGSVAPECVKACVKALREVTRSGRVVVDSDLEIVREYRQNLRAQGQPGVGDAFFKWLWDHLWMQDVCTHVAITRHPERGYNEFPDHAQLARFDPSDRKFLAVAAAHHESPAILQATDSKWWGFRKAFSECGIRVKFLCPAQVKAKHKKKSRAR